MVWLCYDDTRLDIHKKVDKVLLHVVMLFTGCPLGFNAEIILLGSSSWVGIGDHYQSREEDIKPLYMKMLNCLKPLCIMQDVLVIMFQDVIECQWRGSCVHMTVDRIYIWSVSYFTPCRTTRSSYVMDAFSFKHRLLHSCSRCLVQGMMCVLMT